MLQNSSLEYAVNYIYSPETKEYFKEVVTTYNNGCYRACTVVLYIVVLTDLMLKLRDLKELYQDSKAISILNKIEREQNDNPKSPRWENILIEEVCKNTSLLSTVDQAYLENLRNMRNICAHPIIDDSYKLSPMNKETVSSLIKTMIESILSKPPYLSKNSIFKEMILDIEKFSKDYGDKEVMILHLKEKYFIKLRDDQLLELFKNLWKLVMLCTTSECKDNRNYNNFVLAHLLGYRNSIIVDRIKNEPDYFNKIEDECTLFLVEITSSFPELYINNILSPATLSKIDVAIKNDIQAFAFAHYKSDDIKNHLSNVSSRFSLEVSNLGNSEIYSCMVIFNILRKRAEQNNLIEDAHSFLIDIYSHACSYDKANLIYAGIILRNMQNFSENNLTSLIECINSNGQIHGRRDHESEKEEIIHIIENKNFNIDLKIYNNF